MVPTGRTIRVRDLMTAEVVTLAASTSADDAARSLTFHQVGGAPVLDHGRIVGVVSKSDLVDPRRRAGGAHPAVSEVMTKVVRAVRPGDPAMMAVRLMVNENVHRAVVVDERGKLVGIVSPMDVLAALARGDALQAHDPLYEARTEQRDEAVDPGPAHRLDFVDLTRFSDAE